MANIRVVWAGMVAMAMVLGGPESFAKGTVTAPLVDYNSAQVALANGVVTVPFGGNITNAVYTVSAGTLAQPGSRFRVTLPSGFTFQSVPTITGGSPVLISGGIGEFLRVSARRDCSRRRNAQCRGVHARRRHGARNRVRRQLACDDVSVDQQPHLVQQ